MQPNAAAVPMTVELRLHCGQAEVEPISDLLETAGASSVAVEDADAGTQAERPLFGEPGMPGVAAEGWRHLLLSALFADEMSARRAERKLIRRFDAGRCRIDELRELPEQDWVRLTQNQFVPVRIVDEFWIVPSWHERPATARCTIRLDPGLAFGTGTHPTTQMCLRWIAAHPGQFARVLDYGCGSGILAIGAALHGATDVDAVDIDKAALAATRANAQANAVRLRVSPPEQVGAGYQLVLANILASPLKVLAPLLASKCAAGGTLLLAGVLERQTDELIDAYTPYLALEVADTQDGWVLLSHTP